MLPSWGAPPTGSNCLWMLPPLNTLLLGAWVSASESEGTHVPAATLSSDDYCSSEFLSPDSSPFLRKPAMDRDSGRKCRTTRTCWLGTCGPSGRGAETLSWRKGGLDLGILQHCSLLCCKWRSRGTAGSEGNFITETHWGRPGAFPGGARGKEPACQCRRHKRCGFNPWVGKIPWRKTWQRTPVFLPGESHGQGSLAGSQRVGHDWSNLARTHEGGLCPFQTKVVLCPRGWREVQDTQMLARWEGLGNLEAIQTQGSHRLPSPRHLSRKGVRCRTEWVKPSGLPWRIRI